jgi:hypothetical protein
MQFNLSRSIIAAIVGCACLFPAGEVSARWHRLLPSPQKSPTAGYTPKTPHFATVSPTPMANPAAHGELWQFQNQPAPVYPYGWFGARSTPQFWSHARYYGDARDFKSIGMP